MPEAHDADRLSIVVQRTGGFAGLQRTWRAEPEPAERPRWFALVEQCPWDAASAQAGDGADRFVWEVRVDAGAETHRAALTETAVEGAWRELVDAVRAWSTPDPARDRATAD